MISQLLLGILKGNDRSWPNLACSGRRTLDGEQGLEWLQCRCDRMPSASYHLMIDIFVMPVGKEMGRMTVGIVMLMAKVWVLVPSLLGHIGLSGLEGSLEISDLCRSLNDRKSMEICWRLMAEHVGQLLDYRGMGSWL